MNIARDEADERAPNARRHFASPEMLVADATLSDSEKLALLQDWEQDLTHRLRSEEEGFSASDPIRESSEARLADESGRVKTLLGEVAARIEGSD